MDDKIEKIKQMQKEYDRRTEIEVKAEKLICQGEMLKAAELLNKFSDDLQV